MTQEYGSNSIDEEIAGSNKELLGLVEAQPNSYAELMPPEQVERYLKFLENGSMEGLTDAEIAAIRKVDDALALQKVNGQSVLDLRPVMTGENGGTSIYSSREWYDYLNETYGKGDVEWSSGELNGIKAKNIQIIDAETANENWAKMGYTEPPYKLGTDVYLFEVADETEFVRVYLYKTDGTSNKLGGWLIRKQDIEGLSATEIADKYALPQIPTHICDVKVPKGFSLEVGEANGLKSWGNGGGTQFDTMGKFIDEDAFINERLIGE